MKILNFKWSLANNDFLSKISRPSPLIKIIIIGAAGLYFLITKAAV
jgi:hypothetical protein